MDENERIALKLIFKVNISPISVSPVNPHIDDEIHTANIVEFTILGMRICY